MTLPAPIHWATSLAVCGLALAQPVQAATSRHGVFRVVTTVTGHELAFDNTEVEVFRGSRRLLRVNSDQLGYNIRVHPVTGTDITGDGAPDIVLMGDAGGNHNGPEIYVYTATPTVRLLGHMSGDNCGTRLADVTRDGIPELFGCDPSYYPNYAPRPEVGTSCPEVSRPRPTIAYRFDTSLQRYVLDTPRLRKREWPTLRRESRAALQAGPEVILAGSDEWCRVLSAGLEQVYAGDWQRGLAVLWRLGRRSATEPFVEAVERAMRRRQLYLPPGHHHAPLLPTTTLAAVPTDTQGQVISMSRSAWASASVAVSPHRTLMRVQALP